MVTPLALSAGRKSVTVEPSSTSAGDGQCDIRKERANRHWEQEWHKFFFLIIPDDEGYSKRHIDNMKGFHTSYSSRMAAIVEHALCSCRFALSAYQHSSHQQRELSSLPHRYVQ